MKKLLIAAALVLSVSGAQAQQKSTRAAPVPPCSSPCTQQQLLQDIQNQFPDNTAGAITPSILRTFFTNQVNSMMATAPVIGGDLSCYNGTTGLPGTCTGSIPLTKGGTGAISQGGAATNIFPPTTRAGDIPYWTGSNWVTLPGNNSGTKLLQTDASGVLSWVTPAAGFPTPTRTGDLIYWSGAAWVSYAGNTGASNLFMENASGAPSWVSGAAAATLVFPTPSAPGDMVYWNGAAWSKLAGNTTGTKVLQQDGTGNPTWVTPAAGVTSVTCGQGLSGGTITGTGTCALAVTNATSSLSADVSMSSSGTYYQGPQVVQGSTGNFWASGTVTVSDTAAMNIACKLWDGTTVIASGAVQLPAAADVATITLVGLIGSPAGNINISCKSISSSTAKILFNSSGNSKDSTLSVMRIQ